MGKAPRQQLGLRVDRNARRTDTFIKCGSCDMRIHTLYGLADFPFSAPYRIRFHRCVNLVTKANGDLTCYNCQKRLGRKIECGSVNYAELYDVITTIEDSDNEE